MISRAGSRGVNIDVAREFLDSLTWGFRRYNYWAGNTWLTGKLPVSKDDALKLIGSGDIIGVWQCYSFNVDEDCVFRDAVVFEVDIYECEDVDDKLECVVEWARSRASELRPILNLMPVIWWNGNKSLYFINYLLEPVVAEARLRKAWERTLDRLGFDMAVTEAKHAFRVPGTPHPKTGSTGKFLSLDFSVINKLIISRIPARVLFEDVKPVSTAVKPRVTINMLSASRVRRNENHEKPRELPAWVRQLIDYLRENGELCHFGRLAIAEWMLFRGYSEDEIVEVFKHAHDFNENRTRYHIRYAYEHWISQGRKPIACETVREECGNHDMPKDLTCPGDSP
ncbi:hypothetical protein [Vulcanisaeta souniana]|uniref:DNA primase large subunit C-terminal domain-containing protein n=1 Tax=Vulcanisaeta souniana JCM 11219 TaxID=1293586 RepID=A0A830EM43_9CREN|nr:hypothetical protein [Vulcanisaeta souniana]BDR92677.1 hypothetical protein Vsou_17700 [Vulcanisaeta souniana JCM 11219]GGI84465.1 hypothetical protein GCM10007112_21770 [Vulcanisaeta souniana JCM 11219]